MQARHDTARLTTRIAGLSRAAALALVTMLLAAVLAAAWSAREAPSPRVPTGAARQTDAALYREIISRTRSGEPYYVAASAALRENNYPLRPVFTFRLPVLHWLFAQLGERAMLALQAALALGVVAAWAWRLRTMLTPVPLAFALLVLAWGLSVLVQPSTALFPESWSGMLLALMVGLWTPARAWPALLAGAAALAVRELALPMILGMGLLASIERRPREALGWAAIVGAFAVEMTLHARAVAAVVRLEDPASQGWGDLLGLPFAFKSLAQVTLLHPMPSTGAAAAIVLAVAGWAAVRARWAFRGFALVAGYLAMVALLARADTFYWALMGAPLALMGLAFLPDAARDLAGTLRRVQSPTP